MAVIRLVAAFGAVGVSLSALSALPFGFLWVTTWVLCDEIRQVSVTRANRRCDRIRHLGVTSRHTSPAFVDDIHIRKEEAISVCLPDLVLANGL
jgi:uncharacterized protein YifN (PemK superfamily)